MNHWKSILSWDLSSYSREYSARGVLENGKPFDIWEAYNPRAKNLRFCFYVVSDLMAVKTIGDIEELELIGVWRGTYEILMKELNKTTIGNPLKPWHISLATSHTGIDSDIWRYIYHGNKEVPISQEVVRRG